MLGMQSARGRVPLADTFVVEGDATSRDRRCSDVTDVEVTIRCVLYLYKIESRAALL